jgi:hypothetical protein
MGSLANAYLFLLGLASGIALLTLTAYRRVSPAWLKWLLVGSGMLVVSRYLTMALFTNAEAPQRFWAIRYCWFATPVGLILPSVFAIDQLLRHPAMSPRKLLGWVAPFSVAYVAVILFAQATPVADEIVGWTPRLSAGWQTLVSIVEGVFVSGFVGVCVTLMRKVSSRPIQSALLGLALGHGYLGLDVLLLALGRWYFKPFLYSEMVTLLAIWPAYETATQGSDT